MAMNILSIPAMSSENERSFSQAKLVYTSQRLRIHRDLVRVLQLLKQWARGGLFKWQELAVLDDLEVDDGD